MSTAVVTGATHVFSYNDPNARVSDSINGHGSVYTFIAIGTAGQSATVEGSANGIDWVQVITLTIDVGKTSEVSTQNCVLPNLRFTGNAKLQICRGAA